MRPSLVNLRLREFEAPIRAEHYVGWRDLFRVRGLRLYPLSRFLFSKVIALLQSFDGLEVNTDLVNLDLKKAVGGKSIFNPKVLASNLDRAPIIFSISTEHFG